MKDERVIVSNKLFEVVLSTLLNLKKIWNFPIEFVMT